jgi:hypothetical protein
MLKSTSVRLVALLLSSGALLLAHSGPRRPPDVPELPLSAPQALVFCLGTLAAFRARRKRP